MREITAEGTTYHYFTLAEGVPKTNESGVEIHAVESMERVLLGSGDIRIVVIQWPRSNRGSVYCLHWDDGSDLNALDIKVTEGTYTDDDFINSVKTQHIRTLCLHCKEAWDTLVMPTGDP